MAAASGACLGGEAPRRLTAHAAGGYWLLCAGDPGRVVACPTSVVGSIGVITGSFGATGKHVVVKLLYQWRKRLIRAPGYVVMYTPQHLDIACKIRGRVLIGMAE